MTLYTWPPAILPSRFRIEPIANTQSGGRSPFDGTEQTLEQPGMRWAADLSFEGLPAEEHRPLLAFITKLRGRSGRFLWSPPVPRQGTATGSPVMRLAGQTGSKIHTTGWTAGSTNAVAIGDFICWLDPTSRWALHLVTGDADDAPTTPLVVGPSGDCDFHVSPPIRRSPAINAPLYPVGPIGIFRLAEDRNGLDIARGLMAGGSLRIEEAIW